jgi:hypothetical protein
MCRGRTVYIVKDLVPDLTQFYKQYKSIQPYLQNDNPPEKGEFLQSPEDRRKLDGEIPSLFSVFSGLITSDRHVRMHPMCMLLDELSVLLVEPR